ncbi:D-alanine--D-alanine ligase family protein [Marinicella litoralis]|uniref:D-alanine--D-alanine ligase n=1 Tax=Marinicella litoralis TaxID=644220 RepID=A0A4R6XWU2_9GAMM|nr:D-alanine--D-alanine ligase [Marinicella litoralis]TDR22724.1 D-alanine--D-alanine ligase [Marinicella litoralis]
MSDLKVVVLMGGFSAEKEVSLNSGKAVSQALENLGHHVTQVNDIDALKSMSKANIDVVFNVLHGADGEDGQLAAWLNKEGYASTSCNYVGASVSWHKDLAKTLVEGAGLMTPKSQLLKKANDLRTDNESAWIIKPACEGSSVGLFKADNQADLMDAVNKSLEVSDEVLVETFIEGTECTVGIVNGQVLPVVSIQPASELYDYQAKYNSQTTKYQCPANIPMSWQKALQQDALKAYEVMHLSGWCRIDFIVDVDGNRWFLEANTTPGMTTSSLLPKAAKVHGWTFDQLVSEILQGSEVTDV